MGTAARVASTRGSVQRRSDANSQACTKATAQASRVRSISPMRGSLGGEPRVRSISPMRGSLGGDSERASIGPSHPNKWNTEDLQSWLQRQRISAKLPAGVDGRTVTRWNVKRWTDACSGDER